MQRGRAKAYRPIPEAERRAAIEAGLEAYERGDWFLAHELLEPAWMGTADLAERELLQGLIKLAAGFVHGARTNPAGVAKNLRGARERIAAGREAGGRVGIAVDGLISAVEQWLASPGGPAIAIRRIGAGEGAGDGLAGGDTRGATGEAPAAKADQREG